VVGFWLAAQAPAADAQQPPRSAAAKSAEEKRWLAVAAGRVEPLSGEIKVAVAVTAVIGEVLVNANDTVFAGEPLVRLVDNEARARLATAEAQVAMRRRARNKESASSGAAARRKSEDAVANAERAVSDARSALDSAAIKRRQSGGSDADLKAARADLALARDRLTQRKAELREIEFDAPLPTQVEGQLNIARSELMAAEAAMEKLTVRAPIDGTVLQINAKAGELASPLTAMPLVLLGDVSALRVRAEVDERDLGEIKLLQPVVVRAAAFPGREFPGAVSFIAKLVEPGRRYARGTRNMADVDTAEVLVDLPESTALAVGMKVDVYFAQQEAASRQ
jgi:HlyD family secretion protein